MRGKYKFSSVISTIVIVTILIFIMTMMMVISYATRSAYQVEKNAIYEEIVRYEKLELETEANEILKYVQLSASKASGNMRVELKRRVDQAYVLADQIYSDNVGRLSEKEIEAKIIEALRDKRFDDGRGYYFMDRFNGDVMLYPIRSNFEGTNVIDLRDDFGNFVIRDEISIAKDYGEGFVEGHWIKPNQENPIGSLKVSYIRRFRDMNWYIGTGIYEDEYLAAVKETVLNDIKKFKGSKMRENTYFIAEKNGKILLSSNDSVPGYIDDSKLVVADQYQQGDFLQESRMINGEESVLISYIIPVRSWNWIIGFETELSENISESKAYYLKGVINNFNYIALGFSLILLIVFALFMRVFTGRITNCFNKLVTVLTTGTREEADEPFCFKEFEDLVSHIESSKAKLNKTSNQLAIQSQLEGNAIETVVEGEALSVQMIQNLNNMLAEGNCDKMTEIKLRRFASGMSSIRKLLTRLSRKEEDESYSEQVLNLEDIPLKEHLEQVMELILSEYTEMPLRSRVICDKDLMVYSDPLVISQIITHLATNSIKHGFDGSEMGSLTIEVIYDVDYLRVYFSDNGQGMSKYVQERIFDPYYSSSKDEGDVGLGLSEVFNLVNNILGGAINCSSREGFGTDFFIDIPGNGPGLWFDEPKTNEQSS